MSDWFQAFSTRIGSAPGKSECQDFAMFDEVDMKDGGTAGIAVVADGAGSALYSAEGAEISGRFFIQCMEEELQVRKSFRGMDKKWFLVFFEKLVAMLEQHAKNNGFRISDLSCTLIGVLMRRDELLVIQLGDGAVVYSRGKGFQLAFWPDHGEYVNETVFVTDRARFDRLMVNRISGPIESVFVFSDGLQFLILDFKEKKPHQRFFENIAKGLASRESGYSELISEWIYQKVLGSDSVQTGTDDDVSLVVAVYKGNENAT